MSYMTLHRIGQYLVHPLWPRLAFLNGAPRILDAVDVTVDVEDGEEITIYVGDPWRWAQGDSPACHAWQAAIEEYEASCREGMYQNWLGEETEWRSSISWAYRAHAARARADSHAWEIRASIALHDAARHDDSAR